ncbi:MAG TPA: glycosyltransferase family 2 protein [Patescibacteria group bacterium]|nr:glycosyltransferase family 2 protein [Patescibacteria group bacterium]
MKTLVVIPAYNEQKRIFVTVKDLCQNGYDVLVVDDGSRDATWKNLGDLPIYRTRHLVNLGQGAALRTGSEFAVGAGYDFVVHFDADGQHRVKDIEKLVNQLKAGSEVVIGSRFLQKKSDLPGKKKIILGLARIFSKKVLDLQFSDPQSGLRAFRTRVYKDLYWRKNDFMHCSEIMQNIKKKNLNCIEVSIVVNYDEYATNKKVKPKISMGWKMMINKLLN